LGIDVGSTGCKASVYCLNGKQLGSGYRTYAMHRPTMGWAEESPEEWWTKVVEAIRDAIDQSGQDGRGVVAVAVSAANALIPVGANGEALYPAIMQLDQRAIGVAERLKKTVGDEKVTSITGNPIVPGMFSAPGMLWLKENRPDVYEKTEKFLVPSGWIAYKLCGTPAMDYTRASMTMLFDYRTKQWSEELAQAYGLDLKKLPEAVSPQTVIGRVSREAARVTGLPEGIPVAAGAQDTVTAAIGSNCVSPGNALVIVGTVARVGVPVKEFSPKNKLINICFLDEKAPYFSSGAVMAGGLSLNWYLNNLCYGLRSAAEAENKNPYQLLNELAGQVPKGSEGLLYLPHLNGERAPLWNEKARGVFFGISPRHDNRHFARAVMEGVALALREVLETIGPGTELSESFILSGGGAKGKVWREIYADVLQKPMVLLSDLETETRGSAFLAGVASGVFSSYEQASEWIETQMIQEPDPKAADAYGQLFEIYKKLYSHLKEDYEEMWNWTSAQQRV